MGTTDSPTLPSRNYQTPYFFRDAESREVRTVPDAIGIEGWRVDVRYPEDRERAEALLRGEEPVAVEE